MIVRKFMAWAKTAPAGERAEAASALARAYLYSDLPEIDQREAVTALTALLEDASPIVRRALAEAFASAADAPHHCIVMLVNDQSDIASVVLSRSPVLSDAELIDCAAVGDAFAQAAIAVRCGLSSAVAAAIAEVGAREALIALAVNESADIADFSLLRMLERLGADGELREAILSRRDLSANLRTALVSATAQALGVYVTGRNWMPAARVERVTREARECATVAIAADATNVALEATNLTPDAIMSLARHLRDAGQLTAGLVLRALLSGNRGLLEATLAELTQMPMSRVRGIVSAWRGGAFSALYSRAGLPATLEPAFRAALAAQDELDASREPEGALNVGIISRTIESCEASNSVEMGRVMALLRRFEAEAMVAASRQAVDNLAWQPEATVEGDTQGDPPLVLLDEMAEAA